MHLPALLQHVLQKPDQEVHPMQSPLAITNRTASKMSEMRNMVDVLIVVDLENKSLFNLVFQ